ncbi:peroxisomal carnitine O-octanoyltransferase-like isoform X1 [Amphiura filiformis]|uniref:peroxisomal carnitine O-octanoyltransferase-like isoform X1 n=1 Tax=Amphiura filiformis TaxID=82378 RepID=UPI003B217BA4
MGSRLFLNLRISRSITSCCRYRNQSNKVLIANCKVLTAHQPPVSFRTAARICSTMAGSAAVSENPPIKTFQLEDTLPSLPVPPLDKTLQRYLASAEPVLTPDEYQKTAQIVSDFEKGVGKQLHEKLVQKANTSRNWMEKWWEEKAYMETRAPAAVLCNIVGGINSIIDIWPPEEGTQLERAAIFTWYTLSHFQTLRREEVPVDRSRDGKTVWSMQQLKGLFNTGRKPGIERDTLYRHFKTESEGHCPDHIVVISNGHMFIMRPFSDSGELMSSHDLFRQFTYIKEQSSHTRGQGMGALSADDRTTYAKAYDYLCELDPANAQHLKTLETAINVVQLQEGAPKNMSELYSMGMHGPNVHNRFFDKIYGVIVHENGTICCNGDHAPADGIVLVNHFYWIHQNLIDTAGAWPGSNSVTPDLPMPERMVFTVDERVKNDLAHATETYNKNASDVELLHDIITHLEEANITEVMNCQNSSMGKKWIRAQGFHPDAFLQMAFQYTYYRMYNKPAPTYETATTRKYYHGRTETVRSCTMEALTWSKAMQDKSKTNADKVSLLKAAHDKHLLLLKECANGDGCDRHLLGLLILAQEEGISIPEIFTDPAFTKSGGGGNFVLSTSLTGYIGVHGMVMAMTYNGYGIFYCFADDSITLNMAAFKSCPETDVKRFFQQLNVSLLDMQRMLVASKM